MKLIKKITTVIDGFEGDTHVSHKFMLAENAPKNEKARTQEDCVEEDCVNLSWNTYKVVGPITQEEISVLKKFKII